MHKSLKSTIYHHTSGITRAYERCHEQLYDQEGTPIWWTPSTQTQWQTSTLSGWMKPARQTVGMLTHFLSYTSLLILSVLLTISEQWLPLVILLGLHFPLWYNRTIVAAYTKLRGPEALPRYSSYSLILQGIASVCMAVIWGMTSFLLENISLFWMAWGFFSFLPWLLILYMRYQLRWTRTEKAA